MESVRNTQVKIIKGIFVAAVFAAILCYLILDHPAPMIMGLFFGASVSALLFIELGITLKRAVKMSPQKAQTFTMARYFLRFTIMGVVLYVSIGAPHIHLVGTAIGLILIKPVIYATNLFNSKTYFKNIFRRKEDETDGR